MKKSILLVCLLAAICGLNANKAQAQKASSKGGGGETAAVGSNVLNLGVGFFGGYAYAGYSHVSETPAISLYYERIFKQLGPGKLSLGGGFEYKSVSSKYSFGGYEATWRYLIIAFRAAYHPDFIKVEKLDAYGGVAIGFQNVTYTDTYVDNNGGVYGDAYPSRFYPSVFVGARYYFVPQFGVFAEAGYGITILKTGLSLKF
jgi:hypothetical protein